MNNPVFPTIPTARVSQVFDNYNPKMYGGDGRHKGIDFAIPAGTPVYACMDGAVHTVTNTGRSGYGRHIRILHSDGSMSIYGHLSRIDVVQGTPVLAGKQLGLSGGDPTDDIDGDGLSTGAHLHWEIRSPSSLTSDQGAVDPMEYCLQYIPVRVGFAEVIAPSGLYVRSEPVDGVVVYSLKRKQIINVIEIRDEWVRINSLRPEWASKNYIRMTGDGAFITGKPVITDADKLRLLWEAHPELHKSMDF